MTGLLVWQKKAETCLLVPAVVNTEEGGTKRERELPYGVSGKHRSEKERSPLKDKRGGCPQVLNRGTQDIRGFPALGTPPSSSSAVRCMEREG